MSDGEGDEQYHEVSGEANKPPTTTTSFVNTRPRGGALDTRPPGPSKLIALEPTLSQLGAPGLVRQANSMGRTTHTTETREEDERVIHILKEDHLRSWNLKFSGDSDVTDFFLRIDDFRRSRNTSEQKLSLNSTINVAAGHTPFLLAKGPEMMTNGMLHSAIGGIPNSLSNAAHLFSAKLAPRFVKCKVIRKHSDVVYDLQEIETGKVGKYHVKDIIKVSQGEPVLEQLLTAVHETAAVRMLRAMGWRPGQGAGERRTRGEKKRDKQRHKVYGCYMPGDMRENTQQSSDSDSDYDIETLFAPDDYEPYVLRRKDDRFGLGYSGLSRHSVLGGVPGSSSHLVMKDKGKKVSIRGQAFGVGAFEAEDDDIYATEDMSRYDFQLGGPSVEKKKKPIKQGVNVLEGFVKAVKPLPSAPAYPPPALPRGYTPAPAGARKSRFAPTDLPQRDQGLGRHELSAEARGSLLGEEPLKPLPPTAPPPSTPPNTDPIAQLLGRNVNFVTHTEKEDTEKELNFISIKDSGKEINKVFRPFMSNPKKQSRYELFLRDKEAYMREGDSNMDRLNEWEREREIVEFEQAAKLYKPLTGVMNDRFTHASEPDDSTNPLTAVAKSGANYGLASKEMVEAASRGVYGVMTRREAVWRPDPLVSKRFNVPEIGGNRPEQKKEDKPKVSYSIFSYLESSVHDKDSFAKEQTQFSGSKSINVEPKTKANVPETKSSKNIDKPDTVASTSDLDTGINKRMTVAELFMKESEKDLNNKEKGAEVTETIEKFDKMDLYKSIFLSDSEEEDIPPKNDEKSTTDDFIDKPKNVERNTSPPRGIFANIDFDEINSWKRNSDNKKPDDTIKDPVSVVSTEKSVVHNEKPQSAETEEYGPKIPDNLKKRLEEGRETTDNFRPIFRSKNEKQSEVVEVDSSSSADSWVEAKGAKSKKQKKKKSKKHKSKHKKSKHKKKDR